MDEPTILTQLQLARLYVGEGKFLHAAQVYRSVMRSAPFVEDAWLELSRMYFDQKQYVAAEKVLLYAVDQLEHKDEVIFLLGRLCVATGDRYRSLSYFRKLLARERTLPRRLNVLVHYNVGLLYHEKEQWKLAEHYFRKTRGLDPRFPHVQESIAELLLRRGAVEEATVLLESALSADPYSWIAYYLLGLARSKSEEWQLAFEAFANAIDRNPNEPRAWQMCGEVLLKLHQLDESEKYLAKALELNPHLTEAIVGFGFLALARGDRRQANEHFRRALKRDPKNRKALEGERVLRRTMNQ